MIQAPDTSVFDRYINFFSNIDLTDELEVAAEMSIIDVKDSISDGIASDGSTMDTKSFNPVGRYSKPYAKDRQGAGLSVSKRNLNFGGGMVADYGIIEKRKNYVAGGFRTQIEADKAEYNENYMGVKAFDLSSQIREKVIDYIEEKVSNQFARV